MAQIAQVGEKEPPSFAVLAAISWPQLESGGESPYPAQKKAAAQEEYRCAHLAPDEQRGVQILLRLSAQASPGLHRTAYAELERGSRRTRIAHGQRPHGKHDQK